ncbi:MAG: hypothetical protein JSS54_03460 [Proteobacteria bacterium]|nr:hypothetical protein [Pseudomonadota bacterium]MBS0268021.1 hypothetical protein [Pseudomonadota bacterium]
MSTFLKVILASFVLASGTATLAYATSDNRGTYDQCEGHAYTWHGVWDCH